MPFLRPLPIVHRTGETTGGASVSRGTANGRIAIGGASVTARPFTHAPVLVDRVVELFEPVPPGAIIDATVGGAGHAIALLDHRDDISVLGIDQDPDALSVATERLAGYGERARTVHARFDQLTEVVASAEQAAVQPIVGVLFDLGVSSAQFDRGARLQLPLRRPSRHADGSGRCPPTRPTW